MKYDNGRRARRRRWQPRPRRINRISFSIESRFPFVSCQASLPLVFAFTAVLPLRAYGMLDSQQTTEPIYCAEQINIPPSFPHILKQYAKAAIRTQPQDLLRWTTVYFRALANGEVPPMKVRFPLFPRTTSAVIFILRSRHLRSRIHYSPCNIRADSYYHGGEL